MNKKIKNIIEFAMEFFIFVLFYYLLLPMVYKLRRCENIVCFAHTWFNDNIMYLYQEMTKYSYIKAFFVTDNKAEYERLKLSDVKAYYNKDLRNVYLFFGTKIWVTGSGPDLIPFVKARIILRRLFGIRISKWVSLYHGLVFKRLSIGKMLRNYDLGFVTSEFFKQYYSKESGTPRKLRITGYPRTDPLINKKWDKKEIIKEINVPFGRRNILYAPTYGQYHKDFLLSDIKKNFKDIEDFCKRNACNFLIRMHTAWCRRNPEKYKILINKIKESKNIYDLSTEIYPDVQRILYISEVLITDWSSIANDFILLDRPIIFIDVKLPIQEFTLKPKDRVGYIVNNNQDFFEKLQESLETPKLFKEKRRKVVKKLYKHLDGKSSKRCAEEIFKLLIE